MSEREAIKDERNRLRTLAERQAYPDVAQAFYGASDVLDDVLAGYDAGEQRLLRLAQALRLIRDTSGEATANIARRALREAGIPDPPEVDVTPAS